MFGWFNVSGIRPGNQAHPGFFLLVPAPGLAAYFPPVKRSSFVRIVAYGLQLWPEKGAGVFFRLTQLVDTDNHLLA